MDEAVARSDKGGILDSDGPNGPDGIVGPRREKEGSFYTVREVWAPIQFKNMFITPSFKGEFAVSNTYLFTNLKECSMRYRLYATPSPLKGGQRSLPVSYTHLTITGEKTTATEWIVSLSEPLIWTEFLRMASGKPTPA